MLANNWKAFVLLGLLGPRSTLADDPCYIGRSYYITRIGVIVEANVQLDTPGPVYFPQQVTVGIDRSGWIENPVTWPAELHQFWFEDELYYQYYTTPITRTWHVIEPVWDAPTGMWKAAWTYGGYASESVSYLNALDVDANGFVDGDDFDVWAGWFLHGCEWADFDGNGFVNGDDFDAFAACWFFGGC